MDQDPLVVGDATLTLADVVAVARNGRPAVLGIDAVRRMEAARALALAIAERGDAVYGLTTGVGVRKRDRFDPFAAGNADRRLLLDHRSGQGPAVSGDVVRATVLLLANNLARGHAGVRPDLVVRMLAALAAGDLPSVRTYGATGQGDVVPLAELVLGLFGDEPFAVKEGLSLINSNAFTTALACLALADAERLLATLVTCAALDLEALRGNLAPIDPTAIASRPYPGLRWAATGLRAALAGSLLWQPGEARNLQDPLSFRNAAHVLGSAHDTLQFALGQLACELRSSQENPLLDVEGQRAIATASFEILPLATALDVVRIGVAPPITTQLERLVKLLQAPITGLPDGLAAHSEPGHCGLSEITFTAQAIAVEARLLAQPVSIEPGSASQAEGIEDRLTMAPLAARRLSEMVALAERLAALALMTSCQAIELRGTVLGEPLARVHALVRRHVPFIDGDESLPATLEPLIACLQAAPLVW
jgi:histidine ammonia-lyase